LPADVSATSVDRYAQHTCPSTRAAEQRGPTQSRHAPRQIGRPKLDVRADRLRAAVPTRCGLPKLL